MTGSIAELSIYLIIRAGRLPRDRTSTQACLDTNRLRQLAPFWDNRAVYYHQASLDPILLSAIKKPAIIPKCNTAVQSGKGRNEQVLHSNKHIYFHTYAVRYSCKKSTYSSMHICNYTANKNNAKELRPAIYYVQSLIQFYLTDLAPQRSFKSKEKPQDRRGADWTS